MSITRFHARSYALVGVGGVLLLALMTMSACKSRTQSSGQSSAQSETATPPPTPSAPSPASTPSQTKSLEMDEMEDLSCAETRKAWIAQIKNLQLDNQIAQLEGRLQPNRLAIAKLEGKIDEEDMLRSQEESVIKLARTLEKNNPDIANALWDSQRTYFDSIRVARRANASGSESEFKAALIKMRENNKAAQDVAQAYREKLRKAWQADCKKRGGVFVDSPTGSDCKSN